MRVGVIGGGLAGLTAALDLAEGGADVMVLEAGDRFGGQVRTTAERGFCIEEGADGFDRAQPSVHALLHDLRLDADIVTPAALPTLVLQPSGTLRDEQTRAHAAPAVTLRTGMAAVIQGLTRRLQRRADLRLGNAAVAITQSTPGWTIYPELGAAIVVDAVVLALPARPAAWLVHPIAPAPARDLAALGTRAVVTVNLAYARAHVRHPLTAAGFVVTRDAGDEGMEACGFVTSTLPSRAPADQVLLRAVMRPGRGQLVSTTDEGWAELVHEALAAALGLRHPPSASWIARWADAIPVKNDRAAARVASARAALRELGRLELAGAAYDGEGLEGALTSGRTAARSLLGR